MRRTWCGIQGGVSDLPHSHSDDLIRSTLKSSVLHHAAPPAPHLTVRPASFPPRECCSSSELGRSFQLSGFLNASLTHAAKALFVSSIKTKSRKTAELFCNLTTKTDSAVKNDTRPLYRDAGFCFVLIE